jgi:hypothetical protein
MSNSSNELADEIVSLLEAWPEALNDFLIALSVGRAMPWDEMSEIDETALGGFEGVIESFIEKVLMVSQKEGRTTARLTRDCAWLVFACADVDYQYQNAIAYSSHEKVKATLEEARQALQPYWAITERLSIALSTLEIEAGSVQQSAALEKIYAAITDAQRAPVQFDLNSDEVTVKELAERLGITQQAIAKRVKRLTRDGWLEPKPTNFKQYFWADEAKIIEENPPGRKKSEKQRL